MDAEALISENHQLKEQIAFLKSLVEQLRQELRWSQAKLQALLKRLFGSKSETLNPDQLELLLQGLDQPPAAPPPAAPKAPPASRSSERRRAVRQKLPPHLRVEEVVIVPEEVQKQPELWKEIGQEITEELDWNPAQFFKRRYIRRKYVRKTPEAEAGNDAQPEVVIGALPSRLIDKGLPGSGLLAQVVISKYEDHLPLYRQERIYKERHGVKISRATMAEWVERVAEWLKPIYDEMRRSLIAGGYLQADETPIRYLDHDLPGKSQTGYLWAYGRPGGEVVFDWKTSRGREGPEAFLKDFGGLLQADGYGVYGSLAAERDNWTLLGCMAHARRKFHVAMAEDRRAAWMVRQIGHLYGVEKRLREQRAGPALRQAVRSAEAMPVLQRMEKAMQRLKEKVLPKSRMGEAIHYALGQWAALCRYVDHGQAELDNNLIENAIRPTAVGKKNFLFIGHPKAGWRSAVIYSVLGSCRRLGLDPHAYLREILRRLPDMKSSEIPEVTPAAFAKKTPRPQKP